MLIPVEEVDGTGKEINILSTPPFRFMMDEADVAQNKNNHLPTYPLGLTSSKHTKKVTAGI